MDESRYKLDPELLKGFDQYYSNCYGSAKLYLTRVRDIIEGPDGLRNHGVNGAKITTRMKDTDNAHHSVLRRQRDRQKRAQIRAEYPEKFEKEYCKKWQLTDEEAIAECLPFAQLQDILDEMHDLAGVRTALQSPQESHKVLQYLADTFEVLSVRQ